jgi:hypothetical protein
MENSFWNNAARLTPRRGFVSVTQQPERNRYGSSRPDWTNWHVHIFTEWQLAGGNWRSNPFLQNPVSLQKRYSRQELVLDNLVNFVEECRHGEWLGDTLACASVPAAAGCGYRTGMF